MADQLVKSGRLTADMVPILPGQSTEKPSTQTASERMEQIKSLFCSVKNGIITSPMSVHMGKPWEKYRTDNKITSSELLAAAQACTANTGTGYKFGDDLSKALNVQGKDDTQKSGTQKSDTQKANTNTVNTRFVKSATDLGVQSSKMDLQSLQSILAKLQDGGSQSTVTQDTSTTTQPAGTTTQQTPDLTQLTSLLNQLNA
jgi:hypothetical protein